MKNVFLLFSFLCMNLAAVAQSTETPRQTIPFNDAWQFRKAPLENSPDTSWQQVTIPHTWSNVDMQTGKDFYAGDATYQKKFFADKKLERKRVFIQFGGVGSVADVYVNNKYIGEHKGSYAAFCFEITYALRYGTENSIKVKVNNAPRKDVIPVNNFLFAIYGGIYRPVSLIITDKLNISTTDYASSGVYIRQKNISAQSADIDVTVKLENTWHTTKKVLLRTSLYDMKGKLVKELTKPITVLPQGRQSFTQKITVAHPHLWQGRKDPYLYKVVASIVDNGKAIDAVSQPLGIRSFRIITGKGVYLNDQPYRLYGVCRHQDWWGYGNALSNAQQDTDMAMIQEIGATSIRFGHYQQSQHIYNDCDSIGLLVWTEIPFVNAVTGEEADNAKQQMTELIRQNFNHPSIYVWGTSNEVYCKTPEDYTARLIRTLNDIIKTEDSDRWSGSTNGYGNKDRPENFNTDIQGINRYYGWYDGKMGDLERWITGLEKNYPDSKVVLAEYGAEANVDQQAVIDTSKVPVYNGQFFPELYQSRLHEVQWGIIAKHPYLVSSYVWNMFDFATPLWNRGGVPARNMKGLVTFDRKIKKDAFYWYKANWSKEPVLYIADRRFDKRTEAVTNITVYSNRGVPALTVNGKTMAAPEQSTTKVHFIFENVSLQKGKNEVKVTLNKNGQQLSDKVKWVLE
ncbi:MAG: glycoside hydrolase family 2 TIM barrel-domain containing protein [Ginsengibacter sp.]